MDENHSDHVALSSMVSDNHSKLNEINTLLARIDERTKELDRRFITLDHKLIDYITRHEFTPVKLITYGFAGLVMVSVVTALIATVVMP